LISECLTLNPALSLVRTLCPVVPPELVLALCSQRDGCQPDPVGDLF
jgi:hypothetical protein